MNVQWFLAFISTVLKGIFQYQSDLKSVFVFAVCKPFHLFTILTGCDCREILNSLNTFSLSWKEHSMKVMWQIKWPDLSYDLMTLTVIREKVNVEECLNYYPAGGKSCQANLIMLKDETRSNLPGAPPLYTATLLEKSRACAVGWLHIPEPHPQI